jgi:hypothetical protein
VPGAGPAGGPLDRAAALLEALRARLAPACDAATVEAVFRRASASHTAGRDRDGRRVSVITPSGVPFEPSVTGDGGGPAPALRYNTETATSMPFFGPRLSAQLDALDDLVCWLPAEARPAAAGADLREFVATLFPEPGRVPARTRVAIWFGIVHRPESPRHLDRLKVYGSMAADDGALDRVSTARAPMRELAAAVDGLAWLAPHLAAVEVDRSGATTHKLYFRAGRADAGAVSELAGRFGADASWLTGELDRWRAGETAEAAPRRVSFVCCQAGPDGRRHLSVYLSAKLLGLDGTGMADLAGRLAERHHGTTAGLDALAGAATAAGGTWSYSMLGIGVPAGRRAKLNAYLVPDV